MNGKIICLVPQKAIKTTKGKQTTIYVVKMIINLVSLATYSIRSTPSKYFSIPFVVLNSFKTRAIALA